MFFYRVLLLVFSVGCLAGCGDSESSSTSQTIQVPQVIQAPQTPQTPQTPKAWKTPVLIETDNAGWAFMPQVTMNASGNAVAVWRQSDGTRNNIWANRYTAATGLWGTAELIETDIGDTSYPQVAMDASGNAVAVWPQNDGTRNNIWTNRYSAATGLWGTAELIETDNTGSASNPQVAMDVSGNAVVVWNQRDASRENIWSNRYTATTGLWGTAALIEADSTGDASEPQIAMDASGNAVVVWYNFINARNMNDIWSNRYNATTGLWGTAMLIETDDSGNAYNFQVAMDASGNAVAVWSQKSGAWYNVYSNRYTAATGLWGTATLIETENSGDALGAQVAMDASGNAVAVWYQRDGTRENIWSNNYTAATGLWGTAVLIEDNNTGAAYYPQIAMDASGNAVAVWRQSDGIRDNIWSNRYTAATGLWGTAELIEDNNTGSAYYPQFAMDASGNAVAVWQQYDGTRNNIWSNTFK
jgi:hypothetical protein